MVASAGAKLRSCLACKERKVKCDRQQPCHNCTHLGHACAFPQSPIRRKRASKKPSSGPGQPRDDTDGRSPLGVQRLPLREPRRAPSSAKGRLLLAEGGKSLFLADNAWANVKEGHIDVPRTLLSCIDDGTPWASVALTLGAERINPDPSPQPWSPTPAHLELCWHIYVENVDPMVRVLHKRTLHKMVLDAQTRPFEQLDAAAQALLLAVCYSAINSLDSQRCKALFAGDPSRMKCLCHHAVELALARAQLIQTHNMQVLQAFTLFLVSAPRSGSSSNWTMVGLAIRIATSLGLHRDGADFGVPPFEVEMRRRLWWELRLLDFRTSEDCGVPPSTLAESDTRMPLNIEDSDLDQTGDAPPPEREELTEMSFSLLRYELASMMSRLSRPSTGSQLDGQQFREKEDMAAEISRHICNKYAKLFSSGGRSHFFRLAAETSRMVLTKIRLQFHFASARQIVSSQHRKTAESEDRAERAGSGLPDELFSLSVDLLESYTRLLLDQDLAPWKWRMHQYTQWHAVAFVLSELEHRIDLAAQDSLQLPVAPSLLPDMLQRAWNVIEVVFREQKSYAGVEHLDRGPWRPLEGLRQVVQGKLDLTDLRLSSGAECFDLFPWSELDPQGGHLGFNLGFPMGLEGDASLLWSSSFV